MKIETSTNAFAFITCDFYETMADPRNMFESDYNEFTKEESFDFDGYCSDFIPSVKEWANEVCYKLGKYGLNGINITGIGHPREYNFYTDWMNVTVDMDDGWRKKAADNMDGLSSDSSCNSYFKNNYISRSGFVSFTPQSWEEFKDAIDGKYEYEEDILASMYLTLCFIKEFGNIADEKWEEISYLMMESLRYEDYAKTKLLIPEGSEYLFKDCFSAEADEIYHKVLDRYGWAWRESKYGSATELGSMLQWARVKGMTIKELKEL